MPQSHLNFYVLMSGSITAKVGLHNTYPVPPLWYKTCSRHIKGGVSLHTNRHTIVQAQRWCRDGGVTVTTCSGFPYNKLQGRTLYLQVMDYDRFCRDDPIGEICVPLSDVDLLRGETLYKTLQPCKGHTVSDSQSPLHPSASLIDTVRIVCGAGCMKRSSVRASVSPSDLSYRLTAAAACDGFAAARSAGRRYRSIAARRACSRHRRSAAAAPQHGAQQQIALSSKCRVVLTADITQTC